jgi:hypothetical protein
MLVAIMLSKLVLPVCPFKCLYSIRLLLCNRKCTRSTFILHITVVQRMCSVVEKCQFSLKLAMCWSDENRSGISRSEVYVQFWECAACKDPFSELCAKNAKKLSEHDVRLSPSTAFPGL